MKLVKVTKINQVTDDFSDYYTKSQTDALIPTVPTALSQLTTDDNNQRVSVTEKTKTQQQVIFTYTL